MSQGFWLIAHIIFRRFVVVFFVGVEHVTTPLRDTFFIICKGKTQNNYLVNTLWLRFEWLGGTVCNVLPQALLRR